MRRQHRSERPVSLHWFVVAGTDTGHDAATEPLATFAQNRQKLLDYAFRSRHTTAESGKP
jgi:hypothetical protein